jgi:hypothetical protein
MKEKKENEMKERKLFNFRYCFERRLKMFNFFFLKQQIVTKENKTKNNNKNITWETSD